MGNKIKSGQALLETLFAISIVTIMITGLVVGVIFAQKAIRSAQNRAKATQIAQQRIEFLRGEKREKIFWDAPLSYQESGTAITSDKTDFWRDTEIEVEGASPNRRAELNITVSWQEGNEQRDTILQTYLTEY